MTRFRKHKFASTTDIQKMYCQIFIDPAQRDLLRIIWKNREDADPTEFRLKTVTYGTASAPFLAIRTLKQLALDESSRFPLASDDTQQDTYLLAHAIKKTILVGFADASQAAYGAVVYMKSISETNSVVMKLIASKSRISPIKTRSTPRLELSACLLLSQLVEKIIDALKMEIDDVILHTDSTTALAWINTPPN
ncbi:hypothetical protein AVEN_230358-1 [Araneus ventricosus]|uniref:Uncharacterized protein n=1 Tax=Araneus ventricosus TaxID=182803 RepID=A0A4Y2I6Q2_ARAVE|nr:hypothetical protein AVEN_230358-1 [Araneus ventricosus]